MQFILAEFSYVHLAMGLKNACTYLSDTLDKILTEEALAELWVLHPDCPHFNPRTSAESGEIGKRPNWILMACALYMDQECDIKKERVSLAAALQLDQRPSCLRTGDLNEGCDLGGQLYEVEGCEEQRVHLGEGRGGGVHGGEGGCGVYRLHEGLLKFVQASVRLRAHESGPETPSGLKP